jgi:transcriptional regulator with XRE-family HTH domain
LQLQKSTNPNYGKLLRRVRTQRGLSARQLAKKIGVDATYISKIETGSVPPPAWDKMMAINSVLDSPDLLEAGEYACVKQTLFLAANLLSLFDEMPPGLVNEIGSEKLAGWGNNCSELLGAFTVAWERRARWTDEPITNRKKRNRSRIR